MVSRHFVRFVRSSLIALMGAASAAPVIAPLADNLADDDVIRLAPISVIATRNPIRAFEYPGMVTVTGRDRILATQPSTADDLLRSVPNVEFTGGPRRTAESPSIRGFDGADVIILLDGARQNFGSTHDGRFFLDPGLLREVEVLRGPASSLYGSGGTGGVIEFRSVEAADFLLPGERAGYTVSTGTRTANRESAGTVIGYGRGADSIDVLGAVTKRDSGAIRLGDGNELEHTDDDILSALVKGSVALGEHQRIEGSYQSFSNDAEEPNNGQAGPPDESGTGPGELGLVEKDIDSRQLRLAWSFADPDNDLLDVDAVVYRTESKADERRLEDVAAGPAGELLKRDVDTTGFRIDNRSRLRIADDIAATFTYGGELYRDTQNGAAGTGERNGVPDADSDFLGGFLQAEIAMPEPFGILPGDLLLIPGARYDRFETTSALAPSGNKDSVLSPKIGASYLPADGLMLFASYADAFRAPTSNESHLSGTHFSIPLGRGLNVVNRFVPNPDLRPQRTRTVEVGGGVTWDGVFADGDHLEFKAARFHTEGKDFIDLYVDQPSVFGPRGPNPACFRPGACDGTTNSRNVTSATLHGFELEGTYESRRTRFELGFSTLDGEDDDTGEKLGVLTPPQLHLGAALKLPEHDTVLGWRAHAAAEFDRVDDPEERRAGYAVHDFYLAWAPSHGALRGMRLDLGVDNAFDKDYDRVFTGATEVGRNFKVALTYERRW